jgi:hypothetical protein
MSTTTALLIALGVLLAAFVAAVFDYRRICRRSAARFSSRSETQR